MEHRDVWHEMRKHFSEMAESVDRALRKVPPFRGFAREGCPPVNIYETDDEFIVRVEVAGVAKDDLNVSVKQTTLLVEGKEDRSAYESCTCVCEERRAGEFSREIPLPGTVDDELEPAASLDNGILTIRLKKQPGKEGKSIKVDVA